MKRRKHDLGEWLMAVRPWSFPASAMPVVVTLAYLFACHETVNWLNGAWALLNIVLFHAASNIWSDYFDYKHKVDTEESFGVKILTSGQFAPKEIFRGALLLLGVACLAGVGLWLRTGMPLLYIGLGGLACAVLYPYMKYRALGDIVIFISYALLPMLGTAYVAVGRIYWQTFYLALPVGLITVAILHANNTRDVQTDRRAGIHTLVMCLGRRASVGLYAFEILFPFLWISYYAANGVLPAWSLLIWLALVPALQNTRSAVRSFKEGAAVIVRLDEKTAQFQLLFSLLLAVAFVLAGYM